MGADVHWWWTQCPRGNHEHHGSTCHDEEQFHRRREGDWRDVEAGATAVNGRSRREKRQLAIERGEYHEGVPAITVVVDGGWSKRPHKHFYNANSDVGIILGHAESQAT